MTTVADERRDGVKLIEIDPEQLQRHVDGLVRDTFEGTLNALWDADCHDLCIGSVQFYSHISPQQPRGWAGSGVAVLDTGCVRTATPEPLMPIPPSPLFLSACPAADPCSSSAACPTSFQPYAAVVLLPAPASIPHPGMSPPPASAA